MTYLIVALITFFVFLFLNWTRKKGAYYNQVKRALQHRRVDPSRVDEKYGRGKYHATLNYMLKQGLSPEKAAEAIAADLNGEYNEFLEKLNAEEWSQEKPGPPINMKPKQGEALIKKINASFELCVLFAETLAEKPLPINIDTPSTAEFGNLIASFVDSLKVNMDIQIEPGSIGEKLTAAMETRDMDTLSELQHTIMTEVHALSGDERARYIFQMFWPEIYRGLNEAA